MATFTLKPAQLMNSGMTATMPQLVPTAPGGGRNLLPILLLAGVAVGGYLWWKKRHS